MIIPRQILLHIYINILVKINTISYVNTLVKVLKVLQDLTYRNFHPLMLHVILGASTPSIG